MVGILCSRSRLTGVLLLTLSLLMGCSSSGGKLGTVKGNVTIDGVKANSGSVVFTATNGTTISGTIEPDGTYRAIGVPVGATQVSVTSPPARDAGNIDPKMTVIKDMPAGNQPVSKPVPIPAKYGNVGTSGLTFTVKGGENTYDIPLTK